MQVEVRSGGQREADKGALPRTAELGLEAGPFSELVADVLGRLRPDAARFLACAPGRLDVIGGLAECTGSLVLAMPVDHQVCVCVQRRRDGSIAVDAQGDPTSRDQSAAVIPVSQIYGDDGLAVAPQQGLERLSEFDDTARSALGAFVEAIRAGIVSDVAGGLTIAVGAVHPGTDGGAPCSAVAGATLAATARALGAELEPATALDICRRVENDWLQWPVGVADAACALVGEPETLMQLRDEADNIAGRIRLPDDLALVGISCGNARPDAKLRFRRVRVAAFMGRCLVDRIVRHDGGNRRWWDGHLSRISVSDYVERFRDRLPTRMNGREFLDRFGETGDPLTRIEPGFVYKIRSRTEHHIYENARACQFAECLSRGIRTGDHAVFAEAGELMYASHWSYGQRCGLGDVRTDLLVNLIRRRGVSADLYGAKISGRGCGGGVAVLMRSSDRAREALRDVQRTFSDETGHKTTLFAGSAAGALITGCREI